MNDKYLMETLIFSSKVINDLYLHGIIESANENVTVTFMKALQETLKCHTEIFNEMASQGFYTVENVEEQKITNLKNKLTQKEECCD